MENDLRQYITEKYGKVETAMEQREFVENLRFLMMSKEEDFTTYYSNRIVRKSNFYSTVDMLYQLNNLFVIWIHSSEQANLVE